MNSTDPMLPLWFLALTFIGFFIGYLGGRMDRRNRRRPNLDWKRP